MGRNIANTELFEQLLKLERAKTDITPISSVIAQHLQNTSEFLLGEIGTYMPNYTLHNIDHVVIPKMPVRIKRLYSKRKSEKNQ